MYEIFCKTRFSSAHYLRNYPGNCEKLHGHNWDVKVVIRGERLDDLGMLIDFRELKAVLKEVIDDLDHINLNEHKGFTDQNPSSELIARYIFKALQTRLSYKKEVYVHSVTVCETPKTGATYSEPYAAEQQ